MPKLNDQEFYYHDFRGRLLGNKAREGLIVQQLEKMRDKDFFLEVGCAQGHFERIASSFSNNVFGGDYSFERLPEAKESCRKAHFIGINAERLPFKSDSFDFVLCTEVLEHVPKWELALNELQRVSRNKILITVPLEKGYIWKTLSRFSSREARGHLHMLGTAEIKAAKGKQWRIAKQEIVATPSRHLNKLIGSRAKEKIGMYAVLLLEKNR